MLRLRGYAKTHIVHERDGNAKGCKLFWFIFNVTNVPIIVICQWQYNFVTTIDNYLNMGHKCD